MEREILVSADEREMRVALLEAGSVVEAAIERNADRSRVGSIYTSRVSRVLHGMQSAFLDIGLEHTAGGSEGGDGATGMPPFEVMRGHHRFSHTDGGFVPCHDSSDHIPSRRELPLCHG